MKVKLHFSLSHFWWQKVHKERFISNLVFHPHGRLLLNFMIRFSNEK